MRSITGTTIRYWRWRMTMHITEPLQSSNSEQSILLMTCILSYRDSWYRPKVASVRLITVSIVPNSKEAVQFPNNITQEPSGIFDESTNCQHFESTQRTYLSTRSALSSRNSVIIFWKKDETVLHRHISHWTHNSHISVDTRYSVLHFSYHYYIRYLYNDVP